MKSPVQVKAALRKLPDLALHLSTAEHSIRAWMQADQAGSTSQQQYRDALHFHSQVQKALLAT